MRAKKQEEISCPLCNAEGETKFEGYKLNGRQGVFPPRKYEDAERVYRCKQCNLIYTNFKPLSKINIFDEDDSLLEFTRKHPDVIKARKFYTDILAFLKDKAGLQPGAKVLDIGSGTGGFAYALRQQGYETYAIEPKTELFDFSVINDIADKNNTQNVSFESAEYENNSFDFIFLEPLNHLSDPHVAIQKALKWLKPGGYLHLEVINSRWLYKTLLSFFYKITFRKHVPYTSAHGKPFNACEYSTKSFKVYSALNHLHISHLSTYACDTFVRNAFLNKLISKYMVFSGKGMELSVILKKE